MIQFFKDCKAIIQDFARSEPPPRSNGNSQSTHEAFEQLRVSIVRLFHALVKSVIHA